MEHVHGSINGPENTGPLCGALVRGDAGTPAVGLLDSRTTPGPATLARHDAVLGCLRGNGFGVATAGLAFAVLDSYILGFALQEVSLPFDSAADLAEAPLSNDLLAAMSEGAYPHLVEAAGRAMTPGYAFADEFDPGLNLVIDGLPHLIASEAGVAPDPPSSVQDQGSDEGLTSATEPTPARR